MDKTLLKQACDNVGLAPEHRSVMLNYIEPVGIEYQRLASEKEAAAADNAAADGTAPDAADKKSQKKEGA